MSTGNWEKKRKWRGYWFWFLSGNLDRGGVTELSFSATFERFRDLLLRFSFLDFFCNRGKKSNVALNTTQCFYGH